MRRPGGDRDHKASQDYFGLQTQCSSAGFFVISRPERHIRESFEEQYYSALHLRDIEHHIVHANFPLYLKDRRGGSTEIETTLYESSWPPPQIGIIAQRAGNLFVYG
jgi:hypothetical protein